ncbi:MAG: hypothetical protein LCI00_25160 [Chloroflexi bacterium]|nr:hypothetical protein [Chloroflexota bacterium]MCC6895724.1 hypothetical protein [Anaerolineae bacterium]
MPPKISDHHRWSAAYLREAANEHDTAAELLDAGNEAEARHHAYLAHGFETHAIEESGHAAKRSSDLVEDIDWVALTSDAEEEPKPPKRLKKK